MKGIDLQASVTNLPHVDRHQNDAHRMPVVHQLQNTTLAGEEATRRVRMPVQPDAPEGKIADPGDHRPDQRGGQRRRRRTRQTDSRTLRRVNRGNQIDIEA